MQLTTFTGNIALSDNELKISSGMREDVYYLSASLLHEELSGA